MKRGIALGATAFALIWICAGLAVEAAISMVNLQSRPVSFIATHLVALPLAISVGRRVGRLTHASVLLTSLVLVLGMYSAIVLILDAIARPAGGQVSWMALFSPATRDVVLFAITAMVLMPQLWLWLINRLSANNSFKPTPLRGAS
jgi:hypothetical protein